MSLCVESGDKIGSKLALLGKDILVWLLLRERTTEQGYYTSYRVYIRERLSLQANQIGFISFPYCDGPFNGY